VISLLDGGVRNEEEGVGRRRKEEEGEQKGTVCLISNKFKG